MCSTTTAVTATVVTFFHFHCCHCSVSVCVSVCLLDFLFLCPSSVLRASPLPAPSSSKPPKRQGGRTINTILKQQTATILLMALTGTGILECWSLQSSSGLWQLAAQCSDQCSVRSLSRSLLAAEERSYSTFSQSLLAVPQILGIKTFIRQ